MSPLFYSMTTNPLKINFQLCDTQTWLQVLNKHIPSDLTEGKFILRPEFGEGYIYNRQLQDGLSLSFINLRVITPTVLNRIAVDHNAHCIMHFHFSKTKIKALINEKSIELNNQYNSVQLSSSSSSAQYYIPSNEPVELIHLWMSRDWIVNYLDAEESRISNDLLNDTPIAFFETLNFHLKNISYLNVTTSKPKILAAIYDVLNFVFEKFEFKSSNIIGVPTRELNLIIGAKQSIESNLPQAIPISSLAKLCKMSESKFKRLFKKVIGISPYKYHLDLKMQLALQMLNEGKYNVKEVAVTLGYTHMGHFSKAFQTKYGCLPSDILKSKP